MNDLILAAAAGYSWDKIAVWAISLRASGYTDNVGVILYDDPHNLKPETKVIVDNLAILDIQSIIKLPITNGSIFNQRFEDFHQIIKGVQDEFRYTIVTDIRDIYFQTDPMVWLENNLHHKFYAVSEGMLYKHEAWGAENVIRGFPIYASRLLEKCIYNVGVLAGEAPMVADLCLSIALTAKSSGFGVADQSGYNLLLDLEPYKSVANFGLSEDGFTCMAGTFSDPNKIEQFRPNLLEPEPYIDAEGVKTASGKLYSIVHQYDRVPSWNSQLRQDLNNKINTEN